VCGGDFALSPEKKYWIFHLIWCFGAFWAVCLSASSPEKKD